MIIKTIRIFKENEIWFQFFKEALIPSKFVALYAQKFMENRIHYDMLIDLDKPLLNEMGITAIGDCLAILKLAKHIHKLVRDQCIFIKHEIFFNESKKCFVDKKKRWRNV
jgi:hypothetical protein